MLALLYALLLILGYLYAGVVAGAALVRGLLKRPSVSWRAGVLGMLVLYLIGAIPVLGKVVILVLSVAAIGALSAVFYGAAFPRDSEPAA